MTVSADLTDEDRPIIAGRLFLRSAWIGAVYSLCTISGNKARSSSTRYSKSLGTAR